jgi:hypothetical protein
MTTPQTTVEYQVWYDAPDGARRSANAEDTDGAQQIQDELNADEARRQDLAASVGLTAEPHDYNFEVIEVTTSTTPVDL